MQTDHPSSGVSPSAGTTNQQQEGDDVIGFVPRYAIPNITSMLPAYTNSEHEFIHRTFNPGNYDWLKHLPDDLKFQQVVAARTARMEAARQFLMPALSQPLLKSRPDNQQGLFKVFEYMPSEFSAEDDLASKERVASEAKWLAIGGKEFTPCGTIALGKNQDMAPGKLFPYLGGAYEELDETRKAHRTVEESKQGEAPFVPSGTDKLTRKPTKAVAWEMMNNVRKWIMKDWEGAEVAVFENHQDCWVVRINLGTIDSLDGMLAYMNTFVRCNELINGYGLTKVVEFWHTTPDDGGVYYVLRPPWVRPSTLQTYFTLQPLEKHWSTSHGVQEVQKSKPAKDDNEDEFGPGGVYTSSRVEGGSLKYASRLEWGRNFVTNTPAPAHLGKTIGGVWQRGGGEGQRM